MRNERHVHLCLFPLANSAFPILLASITSLSLTLDSIALICFVVILMGGLESILGVLVAGPMVGIIEQLTALYIDPLIGGGFTHIMPFIILLMTVLIRPYGIFGLERPPSLTA